MEASDTGNGPRPVRGRLRWALSYALISLAAAAAVDAAWTALFHEGSLVGWEIAVLQAVGVPLGYIGLGAYAERCFLRNGPRYLDPSGSQFEIRGKVDGKVLASVHRAELAGGALVGANLAAASLWGESLAGADLCCVNLRDACLRDANLDGANLSRANLRGADLSDASLRQADLRGADLRDAFLDDAVLTGAIYNRSTLWSARSKQKRHGCVFVEVDCGYPIPVETSATELDTLPLPAAALATRQTVALGDVTSGVSPAESQATL